MDSKPKGKSPVWEYFHFKVASKPNKCKSPVWEHFHLLDDTQTICLRCGVKIPRTTSRSTWEMRRHLKSRHPDIVLSGELKKPDQQVLYSNIYEWRMKKLWVCVFNSLTVNHLQFIQGINHVQGSSQYTDNVARIVPCV